MNSETQMNVADYENKTIEKNALTQLGVVSVSQVEQPWFEHWATHNQTCMSRTHWVKFWEARVSTSPRVTQAMKPKLKCFRHKKIYCVFSKGKLCSHDVLKTFRRSLTETQRQKPQQVYCRSWDNGLGELKGLGDHSLSGNALGRGKHTGKHMVEKLDKGPVASEESQPMNQPSGLGEDW